MYLFAVTDPKGNSTVYRLAESDWLKLEPEMVVQVTRKAGSLYVSDVQGNQIAMIYEVTRQ